MINITRINHTGLNTDGDIDTIKRFYTDHLGVKTVPRDIPEEYQDLIPGFWMQFSNGQVHMIKNADKSLRNPLGPHIAFYVDSLQQTKQHLESNTIEYEAVDKLVFINDPAGNTIEFQQDPDC